MRLARIHFQKILCGCAAATLATAEPQVAPAQTATIGAQERVVRRLVSTVRADGVSGRLVRATVVVQPKAVQPRLVAPVQLAGPSVPPSALGPNASINELVDDASARHGVDPLLVHSVIKVESNYNPRAISRVGAQGLMQLMPGTARSMGVKNAFDPKENIEGGVKYLRMLQGMFADPALALAAYNAGEGAVQRWGTIPPYAETQDYVVKVARNYRNARAQQPVRVAKTADQPAAPPPPAPTPKIEYSYDEQGRLTMRTVQQ